MRFLRPNLLPWGDAHKGLNMGRYYDDGSLEILSARDGFQGRWQRARVQLHERFPKGEGGLVQELDDGSLIVVAVPFWRQLRSKLALALLVLVTAISTVMGLVWVAQLVGSVFG